MIIEIADIQNTKKLLPAMERWIKENNTNEFNIRVETEFAVNELLNFVRNPHATLLTDENYSGFMGLKIMRSPLSTQMICDEQYWYIIPEKRGRNALQFFKYALKWAKQRGCSHMMMHSSYMASDLSDKVGKFYERMGMKKIETYYMKEVV